MAARRRPRSAVLLAARAPPGPVADRTAVARNAEISSPQLRFDRQTGQWVIVAALRQDRTYKPPADAVPAVPGPVGADQ